MRISEIRVKQIRVNQGLGVYIFGAIEFQEKMLLRFTDLYLNLLWEDFYDTYNLDSN